MMMEKKIVVLGIENSFLDISIYIFNTSYYYIFIYSRSKELTCFKKQFIDLNFEGDSSIRFYGMKKTNCQFKFCGGKGHIDPKKKRHIRLFFNNN